MGHRKKKAFVNMDTQKMLLPLSLVFFQSLSINLSLSVPLSDYLSLPLAFFISLAAYFQERFTWKSVEKKEEATKEKYCSGFSTLTYFVSRGKV